MSTVTEKAWAKLNLTLDVGNKMENGYHRMKMVMQSCSLCDDILLEIQKGTGIVKAKSNLKYLPSDGKNLGCKAAELFMRETGIGDADVTVTMNKRIPVCAGLGGGSSDAAAVLRAMNRWFQTGLTLAELEKMGEQVGSDVPYCVSCGTALAEGRGEILTALPELPSCGFVICKPKFSISTPVLFQRLDASPLRYHPDTDGMIRAIQGGNAGSAAHYLYNVFEEVLEQLRSPIEEIKEFLLREGADGAVMSGTGSAVFGLFANKEKGRLASEHLKSRVPFCAFCESIGRIPE